MSIVESTRELSEDQMMTLIRNTLIVAGKEMGEEGDHWPVIKKTVLDLMKEWDALKVERAVHEQLKEHLGCTLDEMNKALDECPAGARSEMEAGMKELREIYNAYFAPLAPEPSGAEDDEAPIHIQRAEAIIHTLEESEE